MYERMLNKSETPTVEAMTAHCGQAADLFTLLNEWLSETYGTAQSTTFPYGNQYGWGIAHRQKQKLVCNVFPENNAFTVMIRLSNDRFESVRGSLTQHGRDYIDNKYPCGDGGWIHYRVTEVQHLNDIQKIISAKCER